MYTLTKIAPTVIALLVLATGHAQAQSSQNDEEMRRPFDGFYGGLEVGYSVTDLPIRISLTNSIEIVKGGAYYGGYLGWRRQTSSRFVFGGELRFGDGSGQLDGPGTFDISRGRHLGADVTLGYVLGERQRFLPFLSVGYVNTNYVNTESGVRVGGGVEYRLTDSMHLRLTASGIATDDISESQYLGSLLIPF